MDRLAVFVGILVLFVVVQVSLVLFADMSPWRLLILIVPAGLVATEIYRRTR